MKSTGLVLKERAYIGGASPPDAFEDESRFGNDGVHTAVTWVKNPAGLWVRSSNGSTSMVEISDSPSLQLPESLSMAIWTKRDEADTQYDGVFSKYLCFSIVWFGNTRLVYILAGVVGWTYCSGNVAQGTWVHTAISYVNGGLRISFLNGEVYGSTGDTGSITTNSQPVTIGSYADDSGFTQGSNVLAKIWNRGVTPEEIAAIFQNERSFFGV